MYNVQVSSTRKQYNNYHVSAHQNMERELLIKSQLLDGTQESFTATVSKLSMVEQELEMLKIDQYGKIDTAYHKQSSTSESTLYPYQMTSITTPLATSFSKHLCSETPEELFQQTHRVQRTDIRSSDASMKYLDREDDARSFLQEFNKSSSSQISSQPQSQSQPQPLSAQPSQPQPQPQPQSAQPSQPQSAQPSQPQSHHHDPVKNDLLRQTQRLLSSSKQLFPDQPMAHPHQHQTNHSPHTSHRSPQSTRMHVDELLTRFQKFTSPSFNSLSSQHRDNTLSADQLVSEDRISDGEVAMMQAELAKTCKRENAMQEEHRQACLTLQECWDKLTQLRKHIAEFRGAIEETTIEDIHHQTDQWQLNAYRLNQAPSSRVLEIQQQVSTIPPNVQKKTGPASCNSVDEEVKLTSLLLGLDGDMDEATEKEMAKKTVGGDVLIGDIPYIDRVAPKPEEITSESDADESERIIHLQVLREKVRMRDALRSELVTLEHQLNRTRSQLNESSSLLISSSQVGGHLTAVSKEARDKVTSLSTSLSTIEEDYISMRQELLTVETELRTSLEEIHLKEQQKKGGHFSELSLLTEDECDRLIRESQSAMAAKSGVFTWSANPTVTTVSRPGGVVSGSANLTLDEILSGKAKLVRMNGEKAASYRVRLQKRLGGLLVVLGQQQAVVDDCTLAVKVARERMRECEVKRLRLELQMAHIGSILQKRQETAKALREKHHHGRDIPEELTDESGRHGSVFGPGRHTTQQSYHKHKSNNTGCFHLSERNSSEEQKSDGHNNGHTPSRRISPDEELRNKTKTIMSLAGNLLDSEYAADKNDDSIAEEGTTERKADQDTNLDDSGRISPLQKLIRESDRSGIPPSSMESPQSGRQAALSSGFVTQSRASPPKIDSASPVVTASPTPLPTESAAGAETGAGTAVDTDVEVARKASTAPSKICTRSIEYDRDGRKLYRSKSGGLIHSRDLESSFSGMNGKRKPHTGRYSIDGSVSAKHSSAAAEAGLKIPSKDNHSRVNQSQSLKKRLTSQTMSRVKKELNSGGKSSSSSSLASSSSSSSLTVLMQHLERVADHAVAPPPPDSPARSLHKQSDDVFLSSSKKIHWQEAIIKELLHIIVNQTSDSRRHSPVSKGTRRVRSNSLDSHATDLTGKGIGDGYRAERSEAGASGDNDINTKMRHYREILAGVKSKDLIDLLYSQQKHLKTVQLENEVNKMKMTEVLKKQSKQQQRQSQQDQQQLDAPEIKKKVKTKMAKSSTGQLLKAARSNTSGEENCANDDDRAGDVQGDDDDGEGGDKGEGDGDGDGDGDNDDDGDARDVKHSMNTYSRLFQAVSEQEKSPQSTSDDKSIIINTDNADERNTPSVNVTPIGASPLTPQLMATYIEHAMHPDVQEKHHQLSAERTELPTPPPKEFNVYSSKMSEIDSLTLQLQKWTQKLEEIEKIYLHSPGGEPTSRLDLTVLTARYLPEMRKLSSIQSSLYAEVTVERINPHGHRNARRKWKEFCNADSAKGGDDESTISDISKEDASVGSDGGGDGGGDDADPEEVLSRVRQRTLTQWSLRLPDWRTDPLSISFPNHKPSDSIMDDDDDDKDGFFKYLLCSHVVLVTIWSASRSGLDELVARGALPLSELADQKKHAYWLQLRYPSDVYQAVRSRSKIPDGCSVRVDARLMHSKKLLYMAKIAETQDKIEFLSRRGNGLTLPSPSDSRYTPPPATAPATVTVTPTRATAHVTTTSKHVHAVRKVQPYIPDRSAAKVVNRDNNSHMARQQNAAGKRNTPSVTPSKKTSPHKKPKVTSDSNVSVNVASPRTVNDTLKGGKASPPQRPPNLSIFRGAGVRMRDESARNVKKRTSQAVKKGFGSGVDKKVNNAVKK